jgi:hypothetical protein
MERVASHSAHQPIGFAGAVARQFRLLWTTRRPLLLLVATAGLMALAGEPMGTNQVARLLSVWPALVVVVGPIWAFAVFHNEGPSQRLYHWSQPVGRFSHTTARLAAGAAWLLLVYVVLVLVALAFGALDGNGWQLANLPMASWANLFTGALIGYLGVSALTVISDYPLRWLFVILFLIPLTAGLVLNWLELAHVMDALAWPITNSGWGLGFAMGGALAPASEEIMRAALESRPAAGITVPGSWWLATILWASLLGGLVAFLATRHPDTLPRLRWSR